ncbi:hypothetical protein FACS1894111_03860 [Clostridia bacterium]|nr:hypothetical protein FACS1894111_03860 [Clostridia bacterium]
MFFRFDKFIVAEPRTGKKIELVKFVYNLCKVVCNLCKKVNINAQTQAQK